MTPERMRGPRSASVPAAAREQAKLEGLATPRPAQVLPGVVQVLGMRLELAVP